MTPVVTTLRERGLAFFNSEVIVQALFDAYSQPHRGYHDLSHLKHLFSELAPHFSTVAHPVALQLAVWYHDYVYRTDGQYAHNEIESARQMFTLLKKHAPDFFEQQRSEIELAIAFVQATIRHELPQGLFDEKTLRTCALFLDADLSILATSQEKLFAYDDGIAFEWTKGRPPSAEFKAGRAQALGRFLAREPLFFSPEFSNRDATARANLKLLVARWS